MREPRTPEEWQEAVDSASLHLLIDAGEKYGLVYRSSLVANAERCEAILARGRELGYRPRDASDAS